MKYTQANGCLMRGLTQRKVQLGRKHWDFYFLISPFSKSLLASYYVLDTVLSSGGIAVNKIDKTICHYFLAGEEKINNMHNKPIINYGIS